LASLVASPAFPRRLNGRRKGRCAGRPARCRR
jgi:hypothetical protein